MAYATAVARPQIAPAVNVITRVGRALAAGLAILLGSSVSAAETAPNWRLENAGGEVVNYYADVDDKASVLLFWATWCPYCRDLMPSLQAVAEDYAGRPVEFYALNVWEDGDPSRYLVENGFDFRLLLEAEAVAKDYGVTGTPGLFVVGPDREIRYTRASGTEPAAVEAAVRSALDAALADR